MKKEERAAPLFTSVRFLLTRLRDHLNRDRP